MINKNKWWFQFLFLISKNFSQYWHMIYLPNIRKCIFVTGLNDPQANRTHFVGLLIVSSESERAAASSVVDGNSSVIIISGSETGNVLMSIIFYILIFFCCLWFSSVVNSPIILWMLHLIRPRPVWYVNTDCSYLLGFWIKSEQKCDRKVFYICFRTLTHFTN